MKNILVLTFILLMPSLVALMLNSLRRKETISSRSAARVGLALVLFLTGVTHFFQTDRMRMMLPAWIPAARELILITGVLEIAAGIALLMERTAQLASRCLIIFFIAVFPANVWAAFNHIDYGGHSVGPAYLLLRGPLQVLLIFWAWRISRMKSATSAQSKVALRSFKTDEQPLS